MSIKTVKKIIDGHEVVITSHPAIPANALKVRILNLLGPSAARFLMSFFAERREKPTVDEIKKRFSESQMDFDALASAFELLASKLNPADYTQLILDLLACTHIDGKPANGESFFNDLFASNFLFMYKIIFQVLEVNFGDFFAAAAIGLTKSGTPATPKQR